MGLLFDHRGKPIGDVTLDEAQTTSLMARELERMARAPLILGPIPAVDAVAFVGLVQLACRHPGVSARMRLTAAAMVHTVREYFETCPTVLAVIDAGDDPTRDR